MKVLVNLNLCVALWRDFNTPKYTRLLETCIHERTPGKM